MSFPRRRESRYVAPQFIEGFFNQKTKWSKKTKGHNKTTTEPKISIEQYLKKLARFAGSEYGNMIRSQFKDIKGGSELAMLTAPSNEELQQLKKAVAMMTPTERQTADTLTDEQIQRIAADAQIDPAIFAIFINGYALHCKRVP